MAETDNVKAVIAAELEEWLAGFVQARVRYLSSRVSRSGALEGSLGTEVVRQAQREAVEALIAFEQHGRFIDMKPTAQAVSGQEAIKRIQDWAAKVGVPKFERGFIKRYGRRPVSDEKFLNRIAWGIVKTRAKGKYRRRRWWNASKTASISELLNKVAAALPPRVGSDVAQSLKNGS